MTVYTKEIPALPLLTDDSPIMRRLRDHLIAGLEAHGQPDWFVICLQGSQNYGLADEESDVDTKLLALPKLDHLVFNRAPVSSTYVMENNEHCDVKDVREYFKLFRKQNINFVEVLFTEYHIVNPKYADVWQKLREHAEGVARYDTCRSLKCVKGMAYEKQHALCHEYPSRMAYIDKYGYDPKQLHHIYRLYTFATDYIAGKPYAECLKPDGPTCKKLLAIKRADPPMTAENAMLRAEATTRAIAHVVDTYTAVHRGGLRKESVDQTLDECLSTIVTRAIIDEIQ